MVLHVIWAFVEEIARDCPTFSVNGVVLQWGDRSPAYLRQGEFRWNDDAWEADVEVAIAAPSRPRWQGVLRLEPDVLAAWTRKSVNPRSEAARQLRQVIEAGDFCGQTGVITLTP